MPRLLSGEEMTLGDVYPPPWRRQEHGRSLHLASFHRWRLRSGAPVQICRHVDQVVGDDAEADPAMHAMMAAVATAPQAVAALCRL